MLYTLRFFSSKCSLFHNAKLFGSYIIHVLYTGCAKTKKKNNSGAKGLKPNKIIPSVILCVLMYQLENHWRYLKAEKCLDT